MDLNTAPAAPQQTDEYVIRLSTAGGTVELPIMVRDASIVPGSFNAQAGTVDCIWTTGARGTRSGYIDEKWQPYEEELVVTPQAVDMTRLDLGAVNALNTHDMWDLSSVLGRVTSASITKGKGVCTIALSVNPDNAGIRADIEAGIIRNLSVGYTVQRYEITRAQDRTDGGTCPLARAVAWTPMEISFVPVPFDSAAGTRAAVTRAAGSPNPATPSPGATIARAGGPCVITRSPATNPPTEIRMEQTTAAGATTTAPATQTTLPADPAAATRAAEAATQAATQAANARAADITALCTRLGVTDQAEALIRSGQTLEQVGLKLANDLATRSAGGPGTLNVTRVSTVADELETRVEGLCDALMHRMNGAPGKLSDNARQYRGLRLLDMGREYLESRGIRTRGLSQHELVQRVLTFRSLPDQFQFRDGAGLLSTSDFGNLLANVATKRLRMGYDENPGTYALWARRAPNAPDFKSMTVAQISAAPDLLQTNEAGEFKYSKVSDGGESYGLLSYGRIVGISRQAMINDDLRGFDRMVAGFGAASRRLENRLVYAQLTGNPTLGNDSVALFHATHANLGTGGGSALQFSALVTARTAMRVQKGLQSEELNIAPAFLLAPAALEQTAYQLTSPNYLPATQGTVSEFRTGGRTALTPIIEPVLDANSSTAWYLAGSNAQVDTVEYCYLDGAEGPVLSSRQGFEVDGFEFKCHEDFAAKVLDFRGLYKAAGV